MTKLGSDASSLDITQSVLGAVNLGIVVLDCARRVVLWNCWMEQHSGHATDTVLGKDFFKLFPDLRGKRIDAAVDQALRDNFPSLLSQTLHKAPFALHSNCAAAARGERMQQAVAVTPIAVDGAQRHCLIQINDVSFAVGREKLLREQALVLRSQTFSDGLTGIANRRHFDVAIEKEARRAKRANAELSLLMIDIDNFKPYNDQYGHQQGDECLIQVAAALAAMVRRPTDLMARYGGEEFAAILPEADAGQAFNMAESMREKIAQLAITHGDSGMVGHVTISLGIATQTAEHAVDVAALIGAADRALYVAKRSGRNRVIAHGPSQI